MIQSASPFAYSASPASRLMVLVPADPNYGAALHRIWQLASVTHRSVYLLGLCRDLTEELSLRRQLITMSLLLREGKIVTEARIEFGTNWIDVVNKNYERGDIIVCFAEQRDGLLHQPLNQILQKKLYAHIFILSGLYPERSPTRNILANFLLWAGWVTVITGAFLLQTQIASLPLEGSSTSLLILSVIVEFWLIWLWNKLFI